jgi:hemolysin III
VFFLFFTLNPQKMSERPQTKKEELANAITHGIGIIFCLIGIPFLLNFSLQKETLATFWAILAFGIGMLMVYGSSTLYHAVSHKRYKDFLQTADHISIYFLIAGSYTPLIVNFLPQDDALIFLGIMWSLVTVGVFFKVFFTKRFKIVSLLLYLTMGWMIVFVIEPIVQNVPNDILSWILIGGISYTTGVYFYVRDKKSYFHAIWHCFVLGGTISHYIFIYKSL